MTCNTFCNWWYNTQNYRRYIAPMLADFNPSKSDNSHVIYYIDNEEKSLSVQWHNVTLWQPTNTAALGYTFDFQVKLMYNGTIYFYYFNIPQAPNQITVPSYSNLKYSMNIGLEDAAYQHHQNGLYYLYPYSPVDVNVSYVLNHNVVVFEPRKTCIGMSKTASFFVLSLPNIWSLTVLFFFFYRSIELR